MVEKPQTTNPFGSGFNWMEAEKLIPELPSLNELTVREMAIHRRAQDEAYARGQRDLKQRITANFQLAMWGHVL